jgi:hypothetical protein
MSDVPEFFYCDDIYVEHIRLEPVPSRRRRTTQQTGPKQQGKCHSLSTEELRAIVAVMMG